MPKRNEVKLGNIVPLILDPPRHVCPFCKKVFADGEYFYKIEINGAPQRVHFLPCLRAYSESRAWCQNESQALILPA